MGTPFAALSLLFSLAGAGVAIYGGVVSWRTMRGVPFYARWALWPSWASPLFWGLFVLSDLMPFVAAAMGHGNPTDVLDVIVLAATAAFFGGSVARWA